MRRLISSGSSCEPQVGFSRAVVTDTHMYVAGTAPVMSERTPLPESAYEQARRCLEIVVAARSGRQAPGRRTSFARSMYPADPADWPAVGRAHAEVFGAIDRLRRWS